MLVARLRDAALPHALAAGVLGGREPEPRRERPGVLEPGELAGLERDVGGRHGVDALRGRVEGSHPLCDLGGVVAEGGRSDLAGHRIKGDGLYGSRVHVEADEGGSIQHERAPFPCLWRGRHF